jgi:hypothetical protein
MKLLHLLILLTLSLSVSAARDKPHPVVDFQFDDFNAADFERHCSQSNKEYSVYAGYNPEQAYKFGLKIQQAFRERDGYLLLELFNHELENGVRRKRLETQPFSTIFSDEIIQVMLRDIPPCAPLGSRGFAIGNTWYDIIDGRWSISGINDVTPEQKPDDEIAVVVDGKAIHPDCFQYSWDTYDNFENMADQYSVRVKDLLDEPGKLIGSEIPLYNLFRARWCDYPDAICHDRDTIGITPPISHCSSEPFEYKTDRGYISTMVPRHFEDTERIYKVVRKLSSSLCDSLTPFLSIPAEQCHLVAVGEDSGGSKGYEMGIAIYGVFDFPDIGYSVVPTKFFRTINDGLNYVESL